MKHLKKFESVSTETKTIRYIDGFYPGFAEKLKVIKEVLQYLEDDLDVKCSISIVDYSKDSKTIAVELNGILHLQSPFGDGYSGGSAVFKINIILPDQSNISFGKFGRSGIEIMIGDSLSQEFEEIYKEVSQSIGRINRILETDILDGSLYIWSLIGSETLAARMKCEYDPKTIKSQYLEFIGGFGKQIEHGRNVVSSFFIEIG